MWNIYSKDGTTVRATIDALEYHGSYMGEKYVSADIKSEKPISFGIGDYLTYRGEKFEINYDPSVVKNTPPYYSYEGFVYSGVKFNSLADELTRCMFLDVVKEDNKIHYTGLAKFSFFCETVQELADRIKANLDRVYKDSSGNGLWTVVVNSQYVEKDNISLSVDTQSVWEVLSLVSEKFEGDFIVKDRTITIGVQNQDAGGIFKWGKTNGLYEIDREGDSSQSIITRLRAYGNTTNIPERYYNKMTDASGNKIVPDNMAVTHLMLPGFPKTTLDPYLDSDNIGTLGVREGTVYFDGSNGLDDIHPTIENMTAAYLEAAGITVDLDDGDNGNLDEVFIADTITDDGQADNVKQATFKITIKDIAFDINDYLSGETAKISMKDGMCGGREFDITRCVKSGNKYILTCKRVQDSDINLYFPYKDYNIKAGDKFVLLNIEMPDVYVSAASGKLLTKATECLAKNSIPKYTYSPKIYDIYMARQHDEAIKNGTTSYHDTICEGMKFSFTDEDLGIDVSVVISELVIKEQGASGIPSYEVTLKEDNDAGTISKMQSKIDGIVSGEIKITSETLLRNSTWLKAQLASKLSNTDADTAKEVITFSKGVKFGSGEKNIDSDGNATLKAVKSESVTNTGNITNGGDFTNNGNINNKSGKTTTKTLEVTDSATTKNLTVSGKATFFELEIQRASAAGGLTIYSAGTGKIDLVEEIYSTEDTSVLTGWKCYQLFRDADGTTLQQMFKAGDNLVSFSFNTGAGYYTGAANRWWWRRCTAAGFSPVVKDGQRYMTFTVNKTLCAAGSDAPQVGDKVCVLGNSSDADRQRAILVCAYGGLDTGLTAPYFAQYKGINDFDLASHRKSWWGYNSDGDPDNMFIGNFTIQGNSGDDGTPIVRDLGAWKSGTYNYYDRVSYNGSLYLMTNKTAETTTGVPGYSSDWTLQVSKGAQGEAGASINIKGNAVAHYTIDTGKDFSTDGTYLLDSTEDGLSAVVALVSGGAVVQYLTPSTNDTYVTSSDGHLWTYGSAWTDCGVVKGDRGEKGEKGDTGAKGDDGAKGEAGTNGTNGTDAVVYMLVPNQENVTLLASGTVAGGLNYSIYKKVGETLTNIELSTDEYWRWKTENGTIWHNVTEAGSVPISYTFTDDKSGNITVNLLINDVVQDARIVPITANNDAFLNVNTKLGTVELTTQQHTSDISTLTQSSLEMRGSMASLTTRMGTAESKIATSVQYDKTTGKITSDITLSADKINLSGAITANKEFRVDDWGNVMLGTQYGISTYKYIVEDKSNLIFTANATVSLPNDKEYIGRRIIIMSQPNHTSAGVVVDASNQPIKTLSSLPKVEITTGDTFVKGVYGISTQDGATTPSVVIENADDNNSPMYGVKWFGGNCMYYDTTNKYYCEPSKLTLRGGYIELLGVSYNVSRVFRAQTGLLNNEYFRVHMARIGEGETTPTTDDPYSTTRTISDTDTLNGTIDVLTSASSSDAWEAITEMCMWTVVNVNAAELTKE